MVGGHPEGDDRDKDTEEGLAGASAHHAVRGVDRADRSGSGAARRGAHVPPRPHGRDPDVGRRGTEEARAAEVERKQMATPKVMKLIDSCTGMMECKVCGARHCASLKHGGGYRRGSWQCVNGCRLPARRS